MKRRTFLKSTLVGAAALAAPRVVGAQSTKTITFVPHADLASQERNPRTARHRETPVQSHMNKEGHRMPGNPRAMITSAERRFPVRIRIAIPPNGLGQRHTQITSWLDENSGADGWP